MCIVNMWKNLITISQRTGQYTIICPRPTIGDYNGIVINIADVNE